MKERPLILCLHHIPVQTRSGEKPKLTSVFYQHLRSGLMMHIHCPLLIARSSNEMLKLHTLKGECVSVKSICCPVNVACVRVSGHSVWTALSTWECFWLWRSELLEVTQAAQVQGTSALCHSEPWREAGIFSQISPLLPHVVWLCVAAQIQMAL